MPHCSDQLILKGTLNVSLKVPTGLLQKMKKKQNNNTVILVKKLI